MCVWGWFTAGSSRSTPAFSLKLSPCCADHSLYLFFSHYTSASFYLSLFFFSCVYSEICFSHCACVHVPAYMWTCHSLSSAEDRGQQKGSRGGKRVGVFVKVDGLRREKKDGWAEGRRERERVRVKDSKGIFFPSARPPSRLSLLLMRRTSLAGLRSGPVIVYGALWCLTQEPH